MPKPHTFPTLYDEVKTVSISFLNKHGYLKPNQWKNCTMTWSSNGNTTGSISIRINTQHEGPYIELDYKCNEAPINYRVQLISTPSNLGKGVVWYFVCPETGKRCRKLFLKHTSYFVSRFAIPGGMYYNQTVSNRYKGLTKAFRLDAVFEEIHQPYFKKWYAGKETKRYKRLLEKVEKAERFSLTDFIAGI